jgi:hypothetical protein
MPTLIAALLEGLRHTVPFHTLPATNRPAEQLWTAHNDTLLQLRMPLYHGRLAKPRPKQKVFDTAIQSGLAVLGSFALTTHIPQAVVRLERGSPTAISFQPRPFGGANWTPRHGISPTRLQLSWTDPLLERNPDEAPGQLTMDVSTRDMLFMAGKVAVATANSAGPNWRPSGTATLTFATTGTRPEARIVFRPLEPNRPATVVELTPYAGD